MDVSNWALALFTGAGLLFLPAAVGVARLWSDVQALKGEVEGFRAIGEAVMDIRERVIRIETRWEGMA